MTRGAVLAVVWDFDKTLISHYMQEPLFKAYGIDGARFWEETNQLPERYRRLGIDVNPETVYLNHLLSYVRAGRLPGLTNARLRELGREFRFFPGVPEIFHATAELARKPEYRSIDLKIEHYIVSTGLAEMIRGSAVAESVQGVWGCEFLEGTFGPSDDGLVLHSSPGHVTEVASFVDNTTKTRALFEISKGVRFDPEVSVNQKMAEEDRRIPLKNMVYVADGPSDVPAFSVVRKGGGRTLAVYRSGDAASFHQARRLCDDGRVDHFAEADYRISSGASLWILDVLQDRADALAEEHRQAVRAGQKSVPRHIA